MTAARPSSCDGTQSVQLADMSGGGLTDIVRICNGEVATSIAHTGSCGKTQPYVKRFEVVLAVIAGPKPASCPNSRQMPPAGMGTPLTTC